MFCMTEHEKYEQVGRLAEEVSHLKGELNHINEKLNQAYYAYQAMVQGQNFNAWSVKDGKLIIPMRQPQMPPVNLEALLSTRELVDVLEKKQHLTTELEATSKRLRDLAPHLL